MLLEKIFCFLYHPGNMNTRNQACISLPSVHSISPPCILVHDPRSCQILPLHHFTLDCQLYIHDVCAYVCVCVGMYVWMCECVGACVCECMCECVGACMCECNTSLGSLNHLACSISSPDLLQLLFKDGRYSRTVLIKLSMNC